MHLRPAANFAATAERAKRVAVASESAVMVTCRHSASDMRSTLRAAAVSSDTAPSVWARIAIAVDRWRRPVAGTVPSFIWLALSRAR